MQHILKIFVSTPLQGIMKKLFRVLVKRKDDRSHHI